MSRTLSATFLASTVLIALANTALSATELWGATTGPRDMTADWFDMSIDDDVFAQPAYGQFGVAPATNQTAGFTALLGGAVTVGELSVQPFSSLTYAGPNDDSIGDRTTLYATQDSLTGAIGLQTSALLKSGLGPLEALIDLYLAHEFDIDGLRLRTLPGALRRNIYAEPADPAKFDLENALSLRLKGMVPGYFQYETRLRVRSTGIQEITGGIRFRW